MIIIFKNKINEINDDTFNIKIIIYLIQINNDRCMIFLKYLDFLYLIII